MSATKIRQPGVRRTVCFPKLAEESWGSSARLVHLLKEILWEKSPLKRLEEHLVFGWHQQINIQKGIPLARGLCKEFVNRFGS